MFQSFRLLPWRTVSTMSSSRSRSRACRAISAALAASQYLRLVGLEDFEHSLPARAVGRHAAARWPGPRAGARARDPAHGRAVRRARRADARIHADRARAHLGAAGRGRGVRHPQPGRGAVSGRPRRADGAASGHGREILRGRPAAAALGRTIFRATPEFLERRAYLWERIRGMVADQPEFRTRAPTSRASRYA